MLEKEATFEDYIEIILRRKRHFLLPLIIVVSLSCVFTLMLPKVYRSEATILATRRGAKQGKKVFAFSGGLSDSKLKAIKVVIKSRSRIEEVIKNLGLDKGVSNPTEYNKLIRKVQGGLVIQSSSPSIFKIFFFGGEPKLAMQIVNTVCGFFVEEGGEALYTSDDKSSATLNELLLYYEKRVNDTRGVLTKFEIEHQGQMPGSLNENFAELEKYQIELANLELELEDVRDKKAKIERRLSGKVEDSLLIMDEEENLTPLEKELRGLNASLDSLLILYTSRHPLVVKTMNQIETTRRKLTESYRMDEFGETGEAMEEAINVRQVVSNPAYLKLRNRLNDTNEELQSLSTQRENIKKKMAEYEKRVKNLPKSEREYAMLQRDFNVNQNIYQSLVARLEQARIEKEFSMIEQGNKFEVISPAQLPLKPVSPKMSKNIIVGSILGIIFGVVVTFWAEYTDHSIRSLDDVQSILKMPTLAAVPTVFTEDEIINKRRINMFLFVMGSVYAVFIILLIIRELFLAYVPNLLYFQTYKDLVYRVMHLLGVG